MPALAGENDAAAASLVGGATVRRKRHGYANAARGLVGQSDDVSASIQAEATPLFPINLRAAFPSYVAASLPPHRVFLPTKQQWHGSPQLVLAWRPQSSTFSFSYAWWLQDEVSAANYYNSSRSIDGQSWAYCARSIPSAVLPSATNCKTLPESPPRIQ